ncbi:glycosyltransferase family 2 protein [Vibrio sp. SCSIO 43137]|uniref:glycosyltransferase family 2 protein n=1 Tax=Vibrio sp. SCSIO 43137 TaxID=3021011 RepID=UPI0023071239|nr:glycosyltransferase family 2 protein [Vibrio sp. SCSIO 43137]WCE31975.1 glycosyltransferase family 2 protein [Vibrio sp. SCSIO 43137]
MIDLILATLFAVSALLIVYHHLGYPVLLKWYARRNPLSPAQTLFRRYREQSGDADMPEITILVPAYNEQLWIADKIRNLACLDYPAGKMKVIIGLDGCSDNTARLARDTIQEAICAETCFEIIEFSENRGKIAVINELMQRVDSELVALSDVSALISVDALQIAAAHFSNPRIGVVNPCYRILETGSVAETKYWQYQSRIKQAETSLGSTLGSHGAFYLFRTALYEPLEENTINDDFILPMKIIEKGYLAHYDADMLALEQEATSQGNDFKRRLRISAGNMQQVLRLWPLFSPRYSGIAFAFFSGKGLRLLTPYLMLSCLITSLLLVSYPLFSIALTAQLALYAIAMLCYLFPVLQVHTLITFITYLMTGHFANLIGGLRYLLGLENKRWIRVKQ